MAPFSLLPLGCRRVEKFWWWVVETDLCVWAVSILFSELAVAIASSKALMYFLDPKPTRRFYEGFSLDYYIPLF